VKERKNRQINAGQARRLNALPDIYFLILNSSRRAGNGRTNIHWGGNTSSPPITLVGFSAEFRAKKTAFEQNPLNCTIFVDFKGTQKKPGKNSEIFSGPQLTRRIATDMI
jgi:hypothetical protein